jgi:transcriptional regulator with XRE-family HTH domain
MDTSLNTQRRRDGYNIKRLREILGIKQEELADKINLTQQSVSRMEAKDVLEEDILEQISKALHIPVDAIKNFKEDATINIIANTFQDEAMSGWYTNNYKCTFNPIDKVIELYDEKIALMERLLKAEQEKVALLEEVLKGKR